MASAGLAVDEQQQQQQSDGGGQRQAPSRAHLGRRQGQGGHGCFCQVGLVSGGHGHVHRAGQLGVDAGQASRPAVAGQHAGAAGAADGVGMCRVGQQRGNPGRTWAAGVGGGQDVTAVLGIDGFHAVRRSHHRPGHRHGLQHLVLHAARQPQRRHHHRGMLQVGANIGHRASDGHGRAGQRQHGRRRAATDDVQPQQRPALTQQRQHRVDEPAHRVDIGPVVHRPGEDQGLLAGGKRRWPRSIGLEVLGIDAVADGQHLAPALRRQATEERDFLVGDQERPPRPGHHAALVGQQAVALAAVQPGHRPAVALGVLGPFGRVHVHQVGQHRQAGLRQRERRHRRGEHHSSVDGLAGNGARDPGLQRGAAVVAQGQRLACQQPGQAAQPGQRRLQRDGAHVGAQAAQHRQVLQVVRIVDEGAEVDLVAGGQVAQQVVRAHLVALVGRVRHAVHQVQQLGHGGKAGQPRLRTSIGPSALARPMGMRRQVSISSLYLGLLGLFWGTASRL